MINVVESSANITAQLVRTQSGVSLVPMYNWSQFFELLPSIKSYHHFHFSSSVETVQLRQFSNSNETAYNYPPHPLHHQLRCLHLQDSPKKDMPICTRSFDIFAGRYCLPTACFATLTPSHIAQHHLHLALLR